MYWYYLIALVVIGVDQLTKWLIVKNMELYEQIPIINDFFYITSHRNRGAAWGILQDQMIFFYIITVVVVVGVIFYLHKFGKDSPLLAVSLSLILGGAIGNFIDRIFRQEVVDFLDFTIFRYDFPIFNVADSCLCIGVILVLIATFIDEKKKGTTAK
ncbi:signal peptidase II [Lentibacillus sp. L22]|uniref:signal peptidase II n=1 Tax=Lentibacillus TaxID=175304 RepID=UPI0022B0F3CF|nr:signal peptidase II [Lentibacillus daqui]